MSGDQASQFKRFQWTNALTETGVKSSIDGRGRWIDNRIIERRWRSVKYECVYLNAFETSSEARTGIGRWIGYDDTEHPHATHGILALDEAYELKTEPERMVA